jgi:hypothetical protein
MLPILPATAFLSEYMWKIRSGKSSRRRGRRRERHRDGECVCMRECECVWIRNWENSLNNELSTLRYAHTHTIKTQPSTSRLRRVGGEWVSLTTQTQAHKNSENFNFPTESHAVPDGIENSSQWYAHTFTNIIFTFQPSARALLNNRSRRRQRRRPDKIVLRACAFHGHKKGKGRVRRGEWVSTKYMYSPLSHSLKKLNARDEGSKEEEEVGKLFYFLSHQEFWEKPWAQGLWGYRMMKEKQVCCYR